MRADSREPRRFTSMSPSGDDCTRCRGARAVHRIRAMATRVIHFGTGYSGMHALRGIINHPELELVGLVVHSDDKAGKDAGELAGVGPTGVLATQDIDAAIALDADAFCYMATTHGRLKVAIGELCQIL